jgi:hypothetical protein
MALVPETGAGVAGADSYASAATILAYWVKRPHDPLAAIVAAATAVNLDGAAREATAFMDAAWGPFYRGVRRGYVQGLLIPRTGAKDDAGYPLPDLPAEAVAACCELTARALSARLAADIDQSARIKRENTGPLETEYFENGLSAPVVTYGTVGNLLAPILNGSQPGAPNLSWAWA